MSYGFRIKKLRESRFLSQERFGRRIGLSGKSVSAYECGRARPSLKILEKISEVYKVDISGISFDKIKEINGRIALAKKIISDIEKIVTEASAL